MTNYKTGPGYVMGVCDSEAHVPKDKSSIYSPGKFGGMNADGTAYKPEAGDLQVVRVCDCGKVKE
jgi:hypothetical protein